MRLTVFGGTGPTGTKLIERALRHGHSVTAYARDPSRLTHDGVRMVAGQLSDRACVAEAVAGADAVVSALGPIRNSPANRQLAPGYQTIVEAMHSNGVQRIVALGTPAIKDDSDGADRRVSALTRLGRLVLPSAYATNVEIGEVLAVSGLKWTIVRVLVLHEYSPRFACSNPASDPNVRMIGDRGGLLTSRSTAAAALLRMAEGCSYIERSPFVTDR